MNKPISVIIKEFSQNMEKCINESCLPPVLIEIVMKGYYLQIKELAEKQFLTENRQYIESMQNIEKKENTQSEVSKNGK